MNELRAGIDDMSFYVPRLYLDIEELAKARKIEYDKLRFGLGLKKMAFPDAYEDAATMAANAIVDLIDKNKLDPCSIGRIYLGTESALDGAKPMASYALKMLEEYYTPEFGSDCFRNCDVVDLTFACVAGVDALQNTLDWVRGGTERLGIVVSSDFAKYDLGSSGEYTQGAGAVAMLVKQAPRLIEIPDTWGVATESVHDFYKPIRTVSKESVIDEVLELAGQTKEDHSEWIRKFDSSIYSSGILDHNERELIFFRETPVFEGAYSNQCYQERISQAFLQFCNKRHNETGEEFSTEQWDRLVFHLPYAFQAKRMFPVIFLEEMKKKDNWKEFSSSLNMEEPDPAQFDETGFQKAKAEYLRLISKSDMYKKVLKAKIEKGQLASSEVGNVYTASIFLSLMSTLYFDHEAGEELGGKKIGFFSYGSGSKSKVFEGLISDEWKEVVARFKVSEILDSREAINYDSYEQLHRNNIPKGLKQPRKQFVLDRIGDEGYLLGARAYRWAD